jgi:hypothetical protein
MGVIICLLGRNKNEKEEEEKLLLAQSRDTASSSKVARLGLFLESCRWL